MSVLTDLIYGGSNAVAGLTEGAVEQAIAKYGADHAIAFPDTAYFFPTIYAATGVKVKTLGDLTACVGVLKSLITNQEDLGQALNAGLATAVGAEIIEGLKSTGGLSNNSNGAPKNVRPIMDSALVAMCMMQGLTSAIVNPNDLRLMETIKSCDIFKNHVLYSDSYLDL